jgi:hypothetical protein
MSQKLSLKRFELNAISALNKIKGGVEDTTYKQSNGYNYKDYKYGDNEVNKTDSDACACNVWGGTDKTNILAC